MIGVEIVKNRHKLGLKYIHVYGQTFSQRSVGASKKHLYTIQMTMAEKYFGGEA